MVAASQTMLLLAGGVLLHVVLMEGTTGNAKIVLETALSSALLVTIMVLFVRLHP